MIKDKTMTHKLLIGVLILGSVFLVAMDYPPRGTDYSSYRCPGGLVSKEDPVRDVIDKCGDPLEEGRISNKPHRVFIYRFDQTRFVYYFGFLNDRLVRIYAVNCQQDDPNCER